MRALRASEMQQKAYYAAFHLPASPAGGAVPISYGIGRDADPALA